MGVFMIQLLAHALLLSVPPAGPDLDRVKDLSESHPGHMKSHLTSNDLNRHASRSVNINLNNLGQCGER